MTGVEHAGRPHDFIGKADDIAGAHRASVRRNSPACSTSKSGNLVSAISLKTTEMTNELARVTEQTDSAIENKGTVLARNLRETSQEIARSHQRRERTRCPPASTKSMEDLGQSTSTAHRAFASKTASTAVAEMLETNGMLRSDTTVLFERLREANGLLQEVLAGANTNLGSIEQVLSTRVADFVGAMNNLLDKTGRHHHQMDDHIGGFYEVTGKRARKSRRPCLELRQARP